MSSLSGSASLTASEGRRSGVKFRCGSGKAVVFGAAARARRRGDVWRSLFCRSRWRAAETWASRSFVSRLSCCSGLVGEAETLPPGTLCRLVGLSSPLLTRFAVGLATSGAELANIREWAAENRVGGGDRVTRRYCSKGRGGRRCCGESCASLSGTSASGAGFPAPDPSAANSCLGPATSSDLCDCEAASIEGGSLALNWLRARSFISRRTVSFIVSNPALVNAGLKSRRPTSVPATLLHDSKSIWVSMPPTTHAWLDGALGWTRHPVWQGLFCLKARPAQGLALVNTMMHK